MDGHDLRGLWLALAVYGGVFAMKMAVFFATGITVIFAEALHTLSDIFITSLLLISAIWSRRNADAAYMFGYGRAQNIAALVAGTLFISFTSYTLYEESIPRLFGDEPGGFENVGLALGVVVVSMALSAIPLFTLFRQKTKGPAARAQLVESLNDELGLVAALVGMLLAVNVSGFADPIASIVVATIIAFNAVGILRDNAGLLLGRSPSADYLASIESRALSVPGVLAVRDLRAEYVGSGVVHARACASPSEERCPWKRLAASPRRCGDAFTRQTTRATAS
ncbi:MAG: cation diffusion facilitator family transporter [Dehalococcoidia bacterium]|nr:cation diffusion facilitator family transporter [Dehalococcoidia bacterium]